MMSDLWPDFKENYDAEESNALNFLREQAKLLNKKTNGKIKATFSKTQVNVIAENMISIIGNIFPTQTEEVLEPELQDKDDINKQFNFTEYKFEIFTEKYRFRLFTLKNRLFFPIEICIDGGICEEYSFSSKKKIYSNDELVEIVGKVFNSQKLKLIISRLLREE